MEISVNVNTLITKYSLIYLPHFVHSISNASLFSFKKNKAKTKKRTYIITNVYISFTNIYYYLLVYYLLVLLLLSLDTYAYT